MPNESDEDRCPNCHHEENTETKTFCKHCGYEYKEEDDPAPWYFWIIAFMFIITVIILSGWLLWIILSWITGDQSLVDVFKEQWNYLISKKIF
jgi:uncharacterized protein (DUF983 family)